MIQPNTYTDETNSVAAWLVQFRRKEIDKFIAERSSEEPQNPAALGRDTIFGNFLKVLLYDALGKFRRVPKSDRLTNNWPSMYDCTITIQEVRDE